MQLLILFGSKAKCWTLGLLNLESLGGVPGMCRIPLLCPIESRDRDIFVKVLENREICCCLQSVDLIWGACLYCDFAHLLFV